MRFQEDLHFHVEPAGDGYDEVLYQIDGRTPTWQEVQKHRRAKRFAKHRDEAASFQLNNPIGEDLALGPMILDQPYRLLGEEELDESAVNESSSTPDPKLRDYPRGGDSSTP